MKGSLFGAKNILFVLAVVFLLSPQLASATSCSSNDCTLTLGKFRVDNNKWGNTGATQSIFTSGTTFGWSWSNSGSGFNYPEIIAGRARNCGTNTWSVFPIQYKNLNSASSTITWKYTQKPTVNTWWNLGFDIYWQDNTNSCDTGKKYNIMIWPHGKPSYGGTLIKDGISDGYNTYTLYYQSKSWPWYAFVLKNRDQIPYEPTLNQQYSIKINIKALMNAMNAATGALDGNWYISGIELGAENSGYLGATSGTQEISSYCLEINGQTECTAGTVSPLPSCTPSWKCESPLNGYEYDGCGNRRLNSACNPPAPAASKSIPGKIEAESYNAMGGVQIYTTADTGGGSKVGSINAGDWTDYSVNVQTAGTYYVKYRVATPYSSQQLQLRSGSIVLNTVTVPNTGAYETFADVTGTASLGAGTQTLRLYTGTGGFDINWFSFASTSSTPVTYSATFSQSGASGTWGVTVAGIRRTTTASSLTVTGLSGTVSYSYDSTISAGTGVRYVCSSGCSGSITASATKSAAYSTQYQLTMGSNPAGGGTTYPPAGSYWYSWGSSASISAAPASGYTFSSWTGSGAGYSGSLNPVAISMSAPVTQTANFAGSGSVSPTPSPSSFSEKFESGAAGWTATGLWHLTTRRYYSASRSFWYGQDSIGNYNTGVANSGYLTSPSISLGSGQKLYFRSWYKTESGTGYDKKLVQISTNGGSTWTQVMQVSDTASQWNLKTIDLSAYAGKTVKIRFYFNTVDRLYNNHEGWYIDNVYVASSVPTGAWKTNVGQGILGRMAEMLGR